MELKIYLIEDHNDRRKKIMAYFAQINALLKNKNMNINDESLACFQNNGYEKIDVIPILPDEGEKAYSNYIFGKNVKWIQQMGKVLRTDERRIFLIDLALNRNERASFAKDETAFRAETAMKLLDYISRHANYCEYIIFESILRNMGVGDCCPALDIEKNEIRENFKYWFMRGNYFVKAQDEYEMEVGISETFGKVLKEINNDKI